MTKISIYPRAEVHTHSNRYLYVTNEGNTTHNSLKEFGVAQGLPAASSKTIYSAFFYSNLVNPNGTLMTRQELKAGSGDWHSAMSYEFLWKHPNTGIDITVRRLKRFRGNELL